MEKTNVMIERFSDNSFRITTTENIDENEMKRRITMSSLYMNAVRKAGLSVNEYVDEAQLSILFPEEEKKEEKKTKTKEEKEKEKRGKYESDYLFGCQNKSGIWKVLVELSSLNGKKLALSSIEIINLVTKYNTSIVALSKKLKDLANYGHCTLIYDPRPDIKRREIIEFIPNFKTNESK